MENLESHSSSSSDREGIIIDDEGNLHVDWRGPNDPEKPTNWSFSRKWSIVLTNSLITFMVSFCSSVYSAATLDIQKEFGASVTVSRLGISLYVFGFAFGPMLWGPASELYGKTRPLWLGYVLFCIFQIPTALAKDIYTLLIFRFLAALAGSSALAILGGMFVDFLVTPKERGIATALFSMATFCGPASGPIIGSIVEERAGRAWISWVTLIAGVVFGVPAFLVTPETQESVILKRKSRKLSKEREKGGALTPSADKGGSLQLSIFVRKYLTKPIVMFVQEPILIFLTLYMSLVYGIIYLTFTLYPLAFRKYRKWGAVKSSLPFLSILLGVAVACFLLAIHSIYHVTAQFQKLKRHVPETRLPPMIFGSLLLPAGMFWFTWTSNPEMSWVPQAISGIFIGCGAVMVFMSGVVYIIEVYLADANSALAINNVVRSAFAAGFPLYATSLFSDAGMHLGGSVVGGLCLFLLPFPILFWRYGQKIRSWSKFANS
ncbi:polyamine transporter 2 [Venturia nashicola]|uniref:Polyamine transporter 2 n=1 Tax=Venturia nashicola TaxID=86259 RepID=A0A4Z1NKC3_9PEZI|nr:polyamine transporter 2 [Venturia nashicola]TLD20092.1 polyamine transporter 2 [Venturia nashicola]